MSVRRSSRRSSRGDVTIPGREIVVGDDNNAVEDRVSFSPRGGLSIISPVRYTSLFFFIALDVFFQTNILDDDEYNIVGCVDIRRTLKL